MSDEIVGVAILDKRDPDLEFLFVLCHCTQGKYAGKEMPCDIPVYPRSRPDGTPGKKVREHQWEYVIQGNRLHITPSLNWIDVFHNAYSWSVEFQEFDPARWEYPGDQFRAVNNRQA